VLPVFPRFQGSSSRVSVDLALIVIGGAILVLGVLSSVVKRLWLSVPLAAMLLGLVLGPQATGLVEIGQLGPERKVSRRWHGSR